MAGEDLRAEHLTRKERIVQVLHRHASRRNYCGDFDRILFDVGLPGRPNMSYAVDRRIQLEGEATEKEYDAWVEQLTRALVKHARARKIQRFDVPMREAGLPVEIRHVLIEGTFSVPMAVAVVGNEDPVAVVQERDAKSRVSRNFKDESRVTWTVREVTDEGETTR